MARAIAAAMAVKRYQDLVVWQAADELRREVVKLTNGGPASRDFKFRSQTLAAVSSISANIVEGYRRFSAREFAQFVDYAYASAGEVSHWLDDGQARGYWTATDVHVARVQLRRLDHGLRALGRYLRSPQAQERSRTRAPTEGRGRGRTAP